ncbi:MAG: ABC transporter permease [Thermoprotei archaeon]
MGFWDYIAKRVGLASFVVVGTLVFTFFLSHILPANPAVLFAGQNPTPQEIAEIDKQYGFNQPLPLALWVYLSNFFRGNLGTSIVAQQPVSALIAQSLPNTLTLAALATIVAGTIGIPLGVLAAKSKGALIDHFLKIFSLSGVALPQFWLGLILQLIFAVRLHVLPIAAYGGSLFFTSHITGSYLIDALITGRFFVAGRILWSLVLPVTTLSLYPLGVIIRQTRGAMMSVLSQDYIKAAKAYGIPEREIHYKYALKNALTPTIVSLGLVFAGSLIGVIYVEQIFFLEPGIGSLIVQALGVGETSTSLASAPDYPLILGITLVAVVVYVASNLIVDLVQALIDRRIAL